MFNLSEIMQSAQGGQAIPNLAKQFGLTPEQTQAAINALASGLLRRIAKSSPEHGLAVPDHRRDAGRATCHDFRRSELSSQSADHERRQRCARPALRPGPGDLGDRAASVEGDGRQSGHPHGDDADHRQHADERHVQIGVESGSRRAPRTARLRRLRRAAARARRRQARCPASRQAEFWATSSAMSWAT